MGENFYLSLHSLFCSLNELQQDVRVQACRVGHFPINGIRHGADGGGEFPKSQILDLASHIRFVDAQKFIRRVWNAHQDHVHARVRHINGRVAIGSFLPIQHG